MKRTLRISLLGLFAATLVGCNAMGGAIMGAGVGYILGDAEMGAAVGATAGLVKDVWD